MARGPGMAGAAGLGGGANSAVDRSPRCGSSSLPAPVLRWHREILRRAGRHRSRAALRAPQPVRRNVRVGRAAAGLGERGQVVPPHHGEWPGSASRVSGRDVYGRSQSARGRPGMRRDGAGLAGGSSSQGTGGSAWTFSPPIYQRSEDLSLAHEPAPPRSRVLGATSTGQGG